MQPYTVCHWTSLTNASYPLVIALAMAMSIALATTAIATTTALAIDITIALAIATTIALVIAIHLGQLHQQHLAITIVIVISSCSPDHAAVLQQRWLSAVHHGFRFPVRRPLSGVSSQAQQCSDPLGLHIQDGVRVAHLLKVPGGVEKVRPD